MAARLNPMHQDMVREKIRGSQLINRLQEHALARAGTKAGLKKLMTDAQVRAAMGLLAKCVPDLQRTEVVGKDGAPLAPPVFNFGFANGGPGERVDTGPEGP